MYSTIHGCNNASAAVAPSHSKYDTNAETSLSKDSPLVENHFKSIADAPAAAIHIYNIYIGSRRLDLVFLL